MTHINVFVAGSKTLQEYRTELVLWANTKNYAYRRDKKDFQINVYSFKEVGDDQDTYNEVITEETDIVLLIVDGTLGDKSKEELSKAKEALHKNKRPKIWVFVKDVDLSSMSYLEGALGRNYTIDFESSERLVNKVNERIDKYVNSVIPNQNDLQQAQDALSQSSNGKIACKTRSKFKIFGIAMAAILSALFIGLILGNLATSTCTNKDFNDKPMLVIAGGGSVANFIEQRQGSLIPVLANYPDGYYLHLPTKSAWKMLIEEIVSLQDTRRYYPVCISAAEATDSDFCSAHITQKMFIDSAIVVSCTLGYDSLAVYMQKGCPFLNKHPECLISNHITPQQLKDLLESKTMNVYSTSDESGTRAGYCKVLGKTNDEISRYLAGQFSELTQVSQVSHGDVPYALLGSQYFQMECTKGDDVKLIVSSDYAKPMLVYFMAYSKQQDLYLIPKITRDFLQKLQVHSLDNYISNDGYIKINNQEHVIYNEKSLVPQQNIRP